MFSSILLVIAEMLKAHGLSNKAASKSGCIAVYNISFYEPNKKLCRDAGLIPLLNAIKTTTDPAFEEARSEAVDALNRLK